MLCDNLIKVFVTGGHGLLGTSIVSSLKNKNINVIAPTKLDLDLLDSLSVAKYIEKEQPTHLIHLASKVYGLQGNLKNQLSSLSYNTAINNSIFNALPNSSVKKIFFAGTVASYPFPYQALPLKEDQLFTGLPHRGEYGYATSKLHAYHYLSLMREYHNIDFVYGLLTNLFGPHDRFDSENGHVIPSLMRKAYEAKKMNTCLSVWGKKDTTRDFLFVNDAAEAIIHLCASATGIYNIASGIETTMGELAQEICKVAEIGLPIEWQSDMPVGIPKRTVDVSNLKNSGFLNKYNLSQGIKITFDWYQNNINYARHI